MDIGDQRSVGPSVVLLNCAVNVHKDRVEIESRCPSCEPLTLSLHGDKCEFSASKKGEQKCDSSGNNLGE